MNKYKVYCETDGWVEVIASSEPTVCPIDGSHTLRAGSCAVIKEDIKVNDGSYTELTLADYKTLRYNEVDAKTGELITQGFTYATMQFSLSSNAQINLLGLELDKAILTYPIEWNNIDDTDKYMIVDATDATNFHIASLTAKKTHLDSGSALKQSIRDCTTEAEVDAIVDNR